jgi:anaerobic selenocysteine-containing dehydrogenase
MNRDDMKERGLKERDVVDLTGHYKGQRRTARQFIAIPYDIPRGNCATYFPEGNALVPIGSTANRSNQPSSKYVLLTVEPAREAAGRFDYAHAAGRSSKG